VVFIRFGCSVFRQFAPGGDVAEALASFNRADVPEAGTDVVNADALAPAATPTAISVGQALTDLAPFARHVLVRVIERATAVRHQGEPKQPAGPTKNDGSLGHRLAGVKRSILLHFFDPHVVYPENTRLHDAQLKPDVVVILWNRVDVFDQLTGKPDCTISKLPLKPADSFFSLRLMRVHPPETLAITTKATATPRETRAAKRIHLQACSQKATSKRIAHRLIRSWCFGCTLCRSATVFDP
jgi:hypothetical protein